MKLWLVRHGETQANVDGLYSGHSPTPLTAKGIGQAETLGTLLQQVPFDHVMCSELERTQQTARLLLGSSPLQPEIVPQLNEMFFGDWEMRHHRDLVIEDAANYGAWCNDWQNAIPTNGEGFQAFSARVNVFIDRLPELDYQNPAAGQSSGCAKPFDRTFTEDAVVGNVAFSHRPGRMERD